jgi:hypothetical protein
MPLAARATSRMDQPRNRSRSSSLRSRAELGQTLELSLDDVILSRQQDDTERVVLVTSRGPVECRLQRAATGDAGVVWVFGAGGGLGGPAGGLYQRLGRQLLASRVTSLEVAYRFPGDLTECVLDALLGVAYLGTLGRKRVVLWATPSAARS